MELKFKAWNKKYKLMTPSFDLVGEDPRIELGLLYVHSSKYFWGWEEFNYWHL